MTTDSGTRGLRGVCSSRVSFRVAVRSLWVAAVVVALASTAGYAQTAVLQGDILVVTGTAGDDIIVISLETLVAGSIYQGDPVGPPPIEPLPDEDITFVQVSFSGAPLFVAPTWNPAGHGRTPDQEWAALNAEIEGWPLADKVKLVRVRAGAGDDIVDCSGLAGDDAIPVELWGEAGDDQLAGGDDDDLLNGGPGYDVLEGNKGDDELSGGGDNDLLRGGEGDDEIAGGGGFDLLDYSMDGGTRSINVNLPAGTATDGWGDSDTVEGISAVRGRGTNDNLIGNADTSTTILGEEGNDTIVGGTRTDYLFGGPGNDTINGGQRDDFIFGGADDDVLFGGADDDALNGNDVICGDGDPPPAWDNITVMVDPIDPVTLVPPTAIPGDSGNDEIHAGEGSDLVFGGMGNDEIYGDAGVDGLYGDFADPTDPDGGADVIYGGDDGEQNNGFALSAYALVGGGLFGGAGNDTLYGGGGSDVLSGDDGSDRIFGGDFDPVTGSAIDTDYADLVIYFLDPAGVNVTLPELGNSSSAADGYGDTDTLQGIEALIGSAFDDRLTGNNTALSDNAKSSHNWNIFGRSYSGYDNIIVGYIGNDVIIGGRGDDALAGGDGDDRTWGDGGNQAQAGNDTIWGDAGADELHGEGGDDIIIGGPGNDNIYAGFGRDTLNFSEPVPFPFIPAPVAADFTVSPATVTDEYGSTDTIFNCDNLGPGGVIAGLNCALNENLFVGRVEVVLGSSLADTIRGYADLPTEIRGGGGNDTLTGGSAADLLYGDGGDDIVEGLGGDDYLEGGGNTTAGDTVIYANATAAVRVSLGQTSAQNTGGAGYDIIAGFENLIGGAFNDVLTGDGRPNTIRGGAGDDVLNGRGDTDVVVGGITVLSQDTLDGEAGTDVADYRQGRPPLNPPPDPGGGVALDDGEGGSDVLVSIENVYLPAGAFFVSAGPDQIIPPGGSVVLPGAASGGSGNPANYRYVWDTVPPIVPPPGKTQDDCTLTVPGLNNRCIAQPTATPGATTVYRLTVTDSLPGGGLALVSSDFVRVTVAPVLVVDAGPAFSINLGQTVQLRGSVSGGVTPYTILWSPGTGLSAMNALMPTASPFSTIEYTLTVVDQTGQQVSDTTTVTVVNPFLVFAGADVAIAQGQNVQMNAAVQGGTQPLTYAWTPTTGLTSSTILNPVATPQVTTTYTVSVTDGDSREVTDSVVITVNPAALPPPDGDGQGGGGTQDGNGSGGDGQGGGGTPDGSGGTGTTPVVPFFSCGLGAGQLLAAGVCSFLSVVVVRHRRRPGGFGTG